MRMSPTGNDGPCTVGNAQDAAMALSDQLEDLATRTKHLEDTAKAADEKNRASLEQERERLHSNVQTEAQQLQASASRRVRRLARGGRTSWQRWNSGALSCEPGSRSGGPSGSSTRRRAMPTTRRPTRATWCRWPPTWWTPRSTRSSTPPSREARLTSSPPGPEPRRHWPHEVVSTYSVPATGARRWPRWPWTHSRARDRMLGVPLWLWFRLTSTDVRARRGQQHQWSSWTRQPRRT
jgi:hypothetical protein